MLKYILYHFAKRDLRKSNIYPVLSNGEKLRKFVKKHFHIHPILISVYPSLALMAFNLGEFDLAEGWRPIFISLIGSLILWVFLHLVVRDWGKSAVITSMIVGFFFSYGHIYNVLKKGRIGDLVIGRHRILLPLFGVLLLIGFFWVIRKAKDVNAIGSVLNWVAAILLIVPLYQISNYQWIARQNVQIMGTEYLTSSSSDLEKPDIYYIILDAYTRQDTLQAMFDYDNREFIQELTDLGFYVAECSQSNYPLTFWSLLTAMSMEYEQSTWNLAETSDDFKAASLLTHSNLRNFLEGQGYNIVAFESGAFWSRFKDADIYLTYEEASETWLGDWSAVNLISDFESLLLETTLLSVFEDIEINIDGVDVKIDPYRRKRTAILYTLKQLKHVYKFPGPKFVFAHIMSPHQPLIFGPNGEDLYPKDKPKDAQEYAQGYTDQVTFLNSRIIPVLESIIQGSKTPPVIILQGDHGPSESFGGTREFRATILNAYYLPADGDKHLYSDISPINTFRIVLNHYFNTDLELLEDVHYYSYYSKGYVDVENYTIIPNIGPICGQD